jgi:hypothetical protein
MADPVIRSSWWIPIIPIILCSGFSNKISGDKASRIGIRALSIRLK